MGPEALAGLARLALSEKVGEIMADFFPGGSDYNGTQK
jgi:hypothetical protein